MSYSGTSPARPLDLWRLVSIVGSIAVGILVWRAIYTAEPASPWVSLAAGAIAGWIAAKLIDSDLVRGLAKLAFYAGVVLGAIWVFAHLGK